MSNFAYEVNKTKGVLAMKLIVGSKTSITPIFAVDTSISYNAILGQDWIHLNDCIPSTLHQRLVLGNQNELEVVRANNTPFVADVHMADL